MAKTNSNKQSTQRPLPKTIPNKLVVKGASNDRSSRPKTK